MKWRMIRRGLHYGESERGTVYVSRTRDGWEYGAVEDDYLVKADETTRPIDRAKILAEYHLYTGTVAS